MTNLRRSFGNTKTEQVRLEGPVRLSESMLNRLPTAGPKPRSAFSQASLAQALSGVTRSFLQESAADAGEDSQADRPHEVIELGDDPGRFAFAFLRSWAADAPALRYTLAGDDQTLRALQRKHPQLAPWVEDGRLDFGHWDPTDLDPTSDLIPDGPSTGPRVVIVNNAFAATRQDAFAVLDGRLLECRPILDAQAEAMKAAEAGTLVREAVHASYDYRPVDLPYYHDAVLDGLLEQYRNSLGSGHFLVPVGAMHTLRRLATSTPGGLLVLHIGRGNVRPESLPDAPPPLRQVGLALPIDFHALDLQIKALGGETVAPQTAAPGCVVAASFLGIEKQLPATRERLLTLVERSGPAGLLALQSGLGERLDTLSFDGLLAYLQVAAWDPQITRLALPQLQTLAEAGLESGERAALEQAVERIWQHYLHLDEPFDLPYELAVTLLSAHLHRPAIRFFQHSVELYGEHTATFYNMGLAHTRVGQFKLARQCLARSLALDPDNAGARDLSHGIQDRPDVEPEASDGAEKLVIDAAFAIPEIFAPASKTVATPISAYVSNLEHLRGELMMLNFRLQREVERWRSTHAPGAGLEELSGTRLTHLGADVAIDSLEQDLLAPRAVDPQASLAPRVAIHRQREAAALKADVPLRLPELAERLGLDDFERNAVLLALAPELDERYERVFGYLENDMQRRWPTVRLALRLFGGPAEQAHGEAWKLDVQGRLSRLRVLQSTEVSSPFPLVSRARGLRLDPRILAFLLDRPGGAEVGAAVADPVIAPHLELQEPMEDIGLGEKVRELRVTLRAHPKPDVAVSLHGPDSLLLRRVATVLVGGPVLVLRADAVAASPDPLDLAARALREAELSDCALLVEGAAALARDGSPTQALRHLLTSHGSQLRVLSAAEPWRLPETCHTTPLLSLAVPAPDLALRVELWREALDEPAERIELGELAGRFQMRSTQIEAAALQLRARARGHDRVETASAPEKLRATLFAICRAQCFVSLDGLAERIESRHSWDDLVLPERVKTQLHGIEHWLRYRHVVYHEWGFAERVQTGRGMAAMFTGSPGTGKTMAAGILGRTLDLDLYRIDLSAVVSKYIGETEKNLATIFDAAQTANAILFFDEADALFGKRSEVKDARDRHANLEVSYLLQRMEDYDGIAILATNIQGNLDAAFSRRLQVVVDFPFPEKEDRQRIWRRLFSEQVPLHEDVDLTRLADRFALPGGSIKNCALDAALAAAAEQRPVAMRDLVGAVAREYEKLGKPVTQAEFG